MKLAKKQGAAGALTLISLVLLYLGLSEPILTITMSTKVNTQLGGMEAEVLNKTRSIIGTIFDLYKSDKLFVAWLILFFSIVVPLLKAILVLLSLWGKGPVAPERGLRWVRRIGKWSMADVMVVAVVIVFLSTRYDENIVAKSLKVFGMSLKVEVKTLVMAHLEAGFYWFVGYCLVSLAALEWVEPAASQKVQ